MNALTGWGRIRLPMANRDLSAHKEILLVPRWPPKSHYCSVNSFSTVIKSFPVLQSYTQDWQIAFETLKSLTFNRENPTIQMALEKWLTSHRKTEHCHLPQAVK